MGIHALRLGFELEGGEVEVEEDGRSEGAADLGKGVEDRKASDSKAENAATIESRPAIFNRIPPM